MTKSNFDHFVIKFITITLETILGFTPFSRARKGAFCNSVADYKEVKDVWLLWHLVSNDEKGGQWMYPGNYPSVITDGENREIMLKYNDEWFYTSLSTAEGSRALVVRTSVS